MTVQHKNLTGTDLHEPKGTSAANLGEVYKADGTGSGSWTQDLNDITADSISTDGFSLNTAVWDDVQVSLVRLSVAGVSAPGVSKINDDGAGSTGVFALVFDAAAEEEVNFSIQLPHRYKAGTDIKPHLHWGATTAGVGDVVWGLEYCISNVGVAADPTTILTVTDATPGATKTQQVASFAAISGTDLKESSVLNCRLFRKAADAADTYAADAAAFSFDIHIQIEKLGTVVEFP